MKHVSRMMPFNSEHVAEISLDNQILQVERELRQQKQERRSAEKLAAAQAPVSTAAPPVSSIPRTRRRLARPQQSPAFLAGSAPTC
jgi:hypothetical protein